MVAKRKRDRQNVGHLTPMGSELRKRFKLREVTIHFQLCHTAAVAFHTGFYVHWEVKCSFTFLRCLLILRISNPNTDILLHIGNVTGGGGGVVPEFGRTCLGLSHIDITKNPNIWSRTVTEKMPWEECFLLAVPLTVHSVIRYPYFRDVRSWFASPTKWVPPATSYLKTVTVTVNCDK